MKNILVKFHSLTLYFLLVALLSGYLKETLIILFIVIFHELGHILITLILGYKIIDITIYPFGGVTKIDKHLNDSIKNDLLIAVFGIFFQIILFFLAYLIRFDNIYFYKVNLSIMLFNLLPIIPLDGSKIIFELLSIKLSYQKALHFYTIISFVFIVIYLIINYRYNLDNYLIVTLFIYKTIEIIKNKKVFYSKFLLERMLYNLNLPKVKNNIKINDYHKDTNYYYFYDNKIHNEKEFIKSKNN